MRADSAIRLGLVGGHCIGVDPYYLTHKAQEIGYHQEVILAGRRINDSMGVYVADQVFKLMHRAKLRVSGSRVLGLAFKQNCPDVRNSRVIHLVRELQSCNVNVDIHDPWADSAQAAREYGVTLVERPPPRSYDAIVLAVAHRQFCDLGSAGIRAFGRPHCVLYDVKQLLPPSEVDGRL